MESPAAATKVDAKNVEPQEPEVVVVGGGGGGGDEESKQTDEGGWGSWWRGAVSAVSESLQQDITGLKDLSVKVAQVGEQVGDRVYKRMEGTISTDE